MKSYETLTERYNQKDVVEILGHLKNDVDSLRSILRRLNKLRKANLPIHNWFSCWILRNANDIQTHAGMLYQKIEEDDK